MTTLQTITPDRAAELIRNGATLVDIRETSEHARENIPGARHHPLSQLNPQTVLHAGDTPVIFHCKSGGRTNMNAKTLAASAKECEAYLLEGGIEAWKKAGLPVAVDRSQPIDIMRQVQIGAGGLVLLGALLGAFVAPGFYALSGFVGAGLLFAGVTGFCGMSRVLGLMPWNRRAANS